MSFPADAITTIRLLLVEPEQRVADRIAAVAAQAWVARFVVHHCNSYAAAMHILGAAEFDAVVAAVPADAKPATEIITRLTALLPGAPIVAIGSAPETDLALPLIGSGAEDYVPKSDAALQALPRIVAYAVRRRGLAARNSRLSHQHADIEALLSAILKAVHTALVVTNEHDDILMSSAAMTACFGWDIRALAGQPVARFLQPPTAADDRPQFRCADDSEIAVATRVLPITLDGRRRNVITFDPIGAYQPAPDADVAVPAEQRLLDQVAERAGRLVAGHLQMVTLDAIRDQLGDRWERAADRIYSSAEAVIRARLKPEDVFTRNDQGDFLICFASLGEAAAWYKAKAIEKEIGERLLGQGFSDTLSTVRVEAHAIPVSATECEGTDDFAALLLGKLLRATEARNRDTDRMLRHVCDTSDIQFQPVLTARGAPSRLMIARFTAATEARIAQIAEAGHDPRLVAQIDLGMLGRVVDHIAALPRQAKPVCFIAPLRFSTLYHRGPRERLAAFLRQVPASVRKQLGFSTEAIPGDMGAARTAALLGTLTPFGRLQMARLPDHLIGRHELDGTLVRIVTMSHAALSEIARARATERLLAQVHDAKARLLIDHLPDDAALALAIQTGADLVVSNPSSAGNEEPAGATAVPALA